MTAATPHFSAVARQMLLHESAGELTTVACTRATASLHNRLRERLAPLVGSAGMRALFARAVKVTHVDFAALAIVRAATLDENANAADSLTAALAALDSAAAWAAATALFANFLELTSSLIGERLVFVVLKRAFPNVDVIAKQESD